MTSLTWPELLRPRAGEYRWRAFPLFLSQGVAVVANSWWTGTWAMPTSDLALVSVVLGIAGVGLRVWAVGLISSSTMASMTLSTDRLVTTGVYGLVRHPVYVGDLLLFLGYGLFLAWPVGIVFVAFHLIRSLRLMAFEETRMTAQYGRVYDEYARRVPMLVPRLAVPSSAPVAWREGVEASAIWLGFAVGYVAVWLKGDVWAITPFETAGFLFAAMYFRRARRNARHPVGA